MIRIQDILDSVLFEPGRYLPADMKDEPKDVPTINPKLLATAYGMLLNELHRSPEGVSESLLRLLKQALELVIISVALEIIIFFSLSLA